MLIWDTAHMMTRLFSILKLVDTHKGRQTVVVCTTENDEREVRRMAYAASLDVEMVMSQQNAGNGIFLNDFPTPSCDCN